MSDILNKVEFLDRNITGRDFVVGDLHGCYDEFLDMLKKIEFDKTVDRVISVGDLIDRGPKNMECVNLVYEPWFYACRGNHEDMMIRTILDDDQNSKDTWFWNGGPWSKNYHETELNIAAKRLNELPLVIVVGDGPERFNVVHADLIHSAYVGEADAMVTDLDIIDWNFLPYEEENMMWGRSVINDARQMQNPNLLSITYVGHTPVNKVVRAQQQVYLDTGAVFYHVGKKTSEARSLTMACPTNGILYSYNMMHENITTTLIVDIERV